MSEKKKFDKVKLNAVIEQARADGGSIPHAVMKLYDTMESEIESNAQELAAIKAEKAAKEEAEKAVLAKVVEAEKAAPIKKKAPTTKKAVTKKVTAKKED